MKRSTVALTIMAVVALVSCGGSGSETTTTASQTTTTPAPTTTVAAPATTTTVPTTTTTAVSEWLLLARSLAGSYSGEWHNLTFNSRGPIDIDLTVDESAGTATLSLDLGGSVFGGMDPPPVIMVFDGTTEGNYSGNDPLFGAFTATFDTDGKFTLNAPSLPSRPGNSVTFTGQFTPQEVTGTYDLPGLANGVFSATAD